MAEHLVLPHIAFPLRMDGGLLRKTPGQESFLSLISLMARTRRGSWCGHELFGFSDFFAEATRKSISPESRKKLLEGVVRDINSVLRDLQLTVYRVESLGLEPPRQNIPGGEQLRPDEHPGFVLTVHAEGSPQAFEFTL